MSSGTTWDNEFRKLDTRVTQLRATKPGAEQQAELIKLKDQTQVLLNITMEGAATATSNTGSNISSNSNNVTDDTGNKRVTTPSAELARRKSMLDSLNKRVNDLLSRHNRSMTLTSNVNASNASASSVTTIKNPTSSHTHTHNNVQTQKVMIQQQDEQLKTLSRGLTDLTQQSMRIGEEADMQVHLLDDMDQNMDDLELNMGRNLNQARSLKDETNYNNLYCWAAGLGALLFVQIMLKVSG